MPRRTSVDVEAKKELGKIHPSEASKEAERPLHRAGWSNRKSSTTTVHARRILVEAKRSSAATLRSARVVQQPAVLQFPVANSEVEYILLASGHVAAVSKKTRILKSHPKRSKFLKKQE